MIATGRRFLPSAFFRTPWLLPALVLVVLAALALLDRRPPRLPLSDAPDAATLIESIGSIEPDEKNPVRSVLRIQWTTCAGAESYEVRFWSQEMREVGRYRAGRTNGIVLDLEQVWRPVAPARQLHWRVVARAEGRDLAASDLRSLRLP
jgi:hypothetical protein